MYSGCIAAEKGNAGNAVKELGVVLKTQTGGISSWNAITFLQNLSLA